MSKLYYLTAKLQEFTDKRCSSDVYLQKINNLEVDDNLSV